MTRLSASIAAINNLAFSLIVNIVLIIAAISAVDNYLFYYS